MIKRTLHKLTAMTAAIAMIMAMGLPVLAAPALDELENGDYELSSVLLDVPALSAEQIEAGYTARLSGPDVSADGTLFMEQGKLYDFTWEQTLPAGVYTEYGFEHQITFKTVYAYFGSEYNQFIPIDGNSLFGLQDPDADVSITVTAEDVHLLEVTTFSHSETRAEFPSISFNGHFTIEIKTRIIGTFELDDPSQLEDVDDARNTLKAAAELNLVRLDEPREITCRLVEDCNTTGFRRQQQDYQTTPSLMSTMFGHGYTRYYETMLSGKTYSVAIQDYYNTLGNVAPGIFCFAGIMNFRALDWTLVPFHPGDFSYSDNSSLTRPNSGNTSSNATLATAATVTAGAGAAALGGSALANVLGEALSSTAGNMIVPDVPVSDIPPADLPNGKKRLFAENETDNDVTPEEDSPNVSMSLHVPGKDILNTKGGAVDITVEISGGDGYLWNYLPAVIIPGAQKAIIPTVTGRSSRTTLVLALTGAKLEERHHTVFVNLIAWASTPDGTVLKTSGSMEMKLHEKGLEAKRKSDGSLTVMAYGETTLKGYAEIRELSATEYTCTESADGKLLIQATDQKLGSTIL